MLQQYCILMSYATPILIHAINDFKDDRGCETSNHKDLNAIFSIYIWMVTVISPVLREVSIMISVKDLALKIEVLQEYTDTYILLANDYKKNGTESNQT